MRKKILFVIMLTILFTMVYVFVISKREGGLVDPTFTPLPTPNAPKTFKFDSSTDLNMELEKVNPQVLDSDFE